MLILFEKENVKSLCIFKKFNHCLVLFSVMQTNYEKNLMWYVSHGCMSYFWGKTMLVWSFNTNDRKKYTCTFWKEH